MLIILTGLVIRKMEFEAEPEGREEGESPGNLRRSVNTYDLSEPNPHVIVKS